MKLLTNKDELRRIKKHLDRLEVAARENEALFVGILKANMSDRTTIEQVRFEMTLMKLNIYYEVHEIKGALERL